MPLIGAGRRYPISPQHIKPDPKPTEMEGFSSVQAGQNPLQSAPTIELCFIHEFARNCYEFLAELSPLTRPELRNEPDQAIQERPGD
jgi:hypothetical protein